MADIFDSYQLTQAWDEMFERPGSPRGPYQALLAALQPLDPTELRYRADQLARIFTDRGVTFDYAGEERPFPLDLIPRIIDAVEWDLIARGVRQRVLALEAFLADVYGPGRVVEDGVVPWELLATSRHFHREAHGLTPPNGSGFTSPASTWSATSRASSASLRTTCACRPESATCWRTGWR